MCLNPGCHYKGIDRADGFCCDACRDCVATLRSVAEGRLGIVERIVPRRNENDPFTKTFPVLPMQTLMAVYHEGTGISGITTAHYYKAMKSLRAWLDRAIGDAEKVYEPEALR